MALSFVDFLDAPGGNSAPSGSQLDGRALYDAMPAMHFVLDRAGTVLSVNAYGAAKLGYSPADLVGTDVLQLCHPDDRQAVVTHLRTAIELPARVLQWECRKIRRNGSPLWVLETARVFDDSRAAPTLLVACHDINVRMAAKERLDRYRRRLQMLTAELSLAEERERRRIATELHDGVGHSLALAKIKLSVLQASAVSAGDVAALSDVRDDLDRAIRATRSLSFELSSPILYELGLPAALAELGERLTRCCGPRFHLSSDPASLPLAQDMRVILYRIADELLVNVVRHARAENVHLGIARIEGEILITVEDDGVGFDPTALSRLPSPDNGLGLLSVRERLGHLGGRLEIGRAGEGGGTRAVVHLPLAACR